jgi:stage V sporulation protein R
MKHLVRLWGFKVRMEETDSNGQTLAFRELSP